MFIRLFVAIGAAATGTGVDRAAPQAEVPARVATTASTVSNRRIRPVSRRMARLKKKRKRLAIPTPDSSEEREVFGSRPVAKSGGNRWRLLANRLPILRARGIHFRDPGKRYTPSSHASYAIIGA